MVDVGVSERSLTLEGALLAEKETRSDKDNAVKALSEAEQARTNAIEALQQAKAELHAREAVWHVAREAAWHTARGELAPESEKVDDHHDHGHGSHDNICHGAVHQLEHRWIEKTGFGCAERVVERAAETLAERMIEQGGDRMVEAAAERLVEAGTERIVERSTEVALEKAGTEAATHMATRAIGESLRMGERAAIHALKALRVIVPFVGMLFVFHLAEHDWQRMREECANRRALTSLLFLLAVAGDLFDIWAHGVVVSAGMVDMDHHFVHQVHHYGMAAAVVACISVMSGEILSARAKRRSAATQKAPVHVVLVTGHDP
mmetsp:Transcript_97639/g.252666  ORF Transcript_97639/g.252666 Transcript_97639/m.252666 type:complete len:320 (-) Transcript_97639:63-1022(-)